MARRTYPPDHSSALKEIASYVTRGWHDRAFEALAKLHGELPCARVLQQLEEVLPEARVSRGIVLHGDAALAAHHAKQDAALRAARARPPLAVDFEPDELALLDAVDALLRPRDPSEAALWEAVYDDPDNDAPRLVLADALIQRGDPRGEFINLQLRTAGGEKPAPEEKELLRRFGQVWLGELAFMLAYPVFRRGFVAEAKYVGNHWDHEFAPRAWATLEVLELEHKLVSNHHLIRPALLGLKKSHGLSGRLIERAAEGGLCLSLEHAGVVEPYEPIFDPTLRSSVLPRLSRCDVLGHGAVDQLEPLLASGVRVVGLNAELEALPRAARLLDDAPQGSAIVLGLRASWAHVDDDWPRWSVTLRRENGLHVEATHHGGDSADALLVSLRDVDLTSLKLIRRGRPRATPAALAALRRELEGRGVALDLAGW